MKNHQSTISSNFILSGDSGGGKSSMFLYYSLHKNSMNCKCGGNILDDAGEFVCTSCGMVEGYDVEAPRLAGRNEVDPFEFGGDLPTTFGTLNRDHTGRICAMIANLKRMRRSNRWSQTHSRSLPISMAQMSRLSRGLRMTEACSIFASDLLRKMIGAKFLAGRTLSTCVAAVALVACRRHGMNTTMESVSKLSGVDRHKLYHMYRTILHEYDVKMPLQDPVEHIAWIGDKVGINEAARRDAHHILQAVDKVFVCGKDPKGLAASALYAACTGRGQKVLRNDIAKAAGVAGTTLTNNCKTLRRYVPECAVVVPQPGRRS